MPKLKGRWIALDDKDNTQTINDADDAREVLTDFLLEVLNNRSLKQSCSGVMVQLKAADLLGSVWKVYQDEYL